MCDGFLNILKPPGMTSHDVVDWVRKSLGIRKVGHTGTLDPGASGVLVIACNKATRLTEFVQRYGKAYRAELELGVATDSHDAFGTVTERGNVPDLSRIEWDTVLSRFVGTIEQLPPMTSAIKVAGKKLYQLARNQINITPPRRLVHIYSCNLVKVDQERKRVIFDVECSKGTYIRTLCADIAASVGTVGYMSFLIRTRVGPFQLNQSQTLIECRAKPCFYPLGAAVSDWQSFTVDDGTLIKVRNGSPFYTDCVQAEEIAVLDSYGRLVALAKRIDAGIYRPHKVLV